MSVGIDVDTTGSPWKITYNGATGTVLPVQIIGAQNGSGIPYNFIPKRMRWVSASAAQNDAVVLKDVPANGGTARTIWHSVATGADFIDESRPRAHESYVGLQVTTFGSGILYIYL